jgi:SAM-dependent methyltransferase
MGCGDGTILRYLLDYGYDLHGYDLGYCSESLRESLADYFPDSYESRIRVTDSEREIPFEDDSFDVVYANQVFEHVKFFDKIMSECARVLRPNGVLLTNFPLASYPVEGHLRIPFAHYIPPGKARVKYLELFYGLGLRPKREGASALETAVFQDAYLRDQTYYRFLNEVMGVAQHYFVGCAIDTSGMIRAKLDLLKVSQSKIRRALGHFWTLVEGPHLDFLVTHLVNAAFEIKYPKKTKVHRCG